MVSTLCFNEMNRSIAELCAGDRERERRFTSLDFWEGGGRAPYCGARKLIKGCLSCVSMEQPLRL